MPPAPTRRTLDWEEALLVHDQRRGSEEDGYLFDQPIRST